MFAYIIVYSVLVISCGFDTAKIALNKKINILLGLVCLFTLFRGLRWEVGTDWEQYLNIFLYSEWSNIFSLKRELDDIMEPGYIVLNVLVKTLGGGYTSFLLLTNFVILYSYFRLVVKCRDYPIYSFASILLSVGFFPVRQNLSVAILLFYYQYIKKRKFISFLLVVLLAASIHYFALIFLFMYVLSDKRITLKMSCCILLGCIILSSLLSRFKWDFYALMSFFPSSVYEKLGIYLNAENDIGRPILELILILIFYFISYFYVKKQENSNVHLYRLYRIFLNATLVMYCFRFLFQDFGDLGRLSDFFSIVGSILLVHSIIYCINNYNKKVDNLFKIAPYFIIILFFVYRFTRVTSYVPHLMFPYKNLFDLFL